VGFDQGRDETLCMVETGAARTDRFYGMDPGWSPETFAVCRTERRQIGEGGVRVRDPLQLDCHRYKNAVESANIFVSIPTVSTYNCGETHFVWSEMTFLSALLAVIQGLAADLEFGGFK